MPSAPDNPGHEYDDAICWSCAEPLRPRGDFTLDGENFQVCAECWEKLSVAERLALAWLYRSRKQGGSGIADCVDAFRRLIEESQDGPSRWGRFMGRDE